MTDDIQTLKDALAKGPTSEQWKAETDWSDEQIHFYVGTPTHSICWMGGNSGKALEDSEYIAACSPDRISRLLDYVSQLEERVEAYEDALKTCVGLEPIPGLEPYKVSAVLAKWQSQASAVKEKS